MKQGFTLIELLAVIAIILIVVLIAAPKIINLINDMKFDAFIDDERALVKVSEKYLESKPNYIPTTIGNTTELEIGTIQTADFIDPIIDPYDHSITCDGYTTITKISTNGYEYHPHLKCGEENTISNLTEDGLVGFWSLNNHSYDNTTNGHNGTNTNVSATTDHLGIANNAYSFNGSTSNINVGDGSLYNLTTTGTIIAWAKSNIAYPSPDASSAWHPIVSKAITGAVSDVSYVLNWRGTNTDRILSFHLSNGTSYIDAHVHNYDFTNWHQVAATWNGSKVTLYSDGVNVNQIDQTVNAQIISQNVEIGKGWGIHYWNGSIDNVQIYNRALSPSEIEMIYKLENERL